MEDRKQLGEVQREVREQAEEKKNRIKGNMVEYLQKTKEERRQAEEREREELQRFVEEEDTRRLFGRYEKALKQLYKYFATQDKQVIEFDLELKNETINQTEFVKFGY